MNTPGQPPSDADPELRRAIHNALDAEPGPAPRVRDAVLRQIRAQHPDNHADPWGRLSAWLRAPLVPRWAPAVAALLIVIQGAALIHVLPVRTNTTAAVTTRALATNATRLRVTFNPLATAAQIRELLDELGARIVGGPTPAGAFVIELSTADPRQLGEKLNAARARHDVLLTLELAPP